MSRRDRIQAFLRRFAATSVVERFLISIAAIILSIFVGAILVLVSGWVATCTQPALVLAGIESCYDPIEVYVELFVGAIGGNPFAPGWSPLNFSVALTLQETTLLVFTGLSVAVAFRAGMFNIGTQGQLIFGALATAVAVLFAAPLVPTGVGGTLVLIPLGVLVGAVVGGLYGAIPGALKAYADANEVITTIMLNFIAIKVAFFIVSTYIRNPASQAVETPPLQEYAIIPSVLYNQADGFALSALGFGVALVVGIYFLLRNTPFGYDLRTSGLQPEAAEYGGVNAERTMVWSMALSGALGGIGGAVWVLMVMGKWQSGVPAFGFDGITVSILAGNNPLGVPFAALLFGTLKSGSLAVEFATGVPKQLVGVLRGLIILFVAMPEFFRAIGKWSVATSDDVVTASDGGQQPVDQRTNEADETVEMEEMSETDEEHEGDDSDE